MRLNRTSIDKITPPETGELSVMDDEVPNFGIRIMASGVRTFFVRYRVGGGRRAQMRRTTLGRHPTMTPERARQAAKTILAEARLGGDPNAERQSLRQALTVAELIDEWAAGPGMRNRSGNMRSDQSFAFEKARLNNHIRPLIGSMRLPNVTKADIERARDQIAQGVTAKVEKTKKRGVAKVTGGEGAASRTLRILSVVLSYAVERGYVPTNVAIGVRKRPDGRGERYLSSEELGRLREALEGVRGRHPMAVSIITLLTLTGCRKREIEALRWSEVDLDHGFLRLTRTKTGSRNIFLSRNAIDLFAQLARTDSEWVFPGMTGPSFYQNTPKVWRDVRRAAKLDGVRIHDLRHTFASETLAQGGTMEVIAALLGHKERRTTERYAHLSSDAVRQAVERVSGVAGRDRSAAPKDEASAGG